jgi:hypothetical protein
MDAPVFPGCVVPSRLVGVIEAEQTKDGKTERNDRLLAVADNSAAHRSIHELRDLSADLVTQIEHFFVSYNEMKGRRFQVKGRAGKKRALTLVTAALTKARETIAPRRSRPRPVERGDLLRDFYISVRDLAAKVVSRKLEGHLAIRDADVGMMIHGLEIGDETIHEAERLNEILKLKRS